jgi:site-specific DNA recombinase
MGRGPLFPLAKAAKKSHAVLYARVSSKEQEQGFSIPAQAKLLEDYATSKGLAVVKPFIEAETAKKAGRTKFGEMLQYLRKNPGCKTVLVEKTDRLYRNLRDCVEIDDLIQKEGLEVHFVKEGGVLSSGSPAHQKLIHHIKVAIAKNYIDNLSEECRKGMLEKANQGYWPSYAPLGYRNVMMADGRRKTIEPDPETAPLVTQLFEWYATGRYNLKELTRMVQAAGLRFRKSGDHVPKSSVHRILRTRLYMGDFDWAGKVYKGAHQPLVLPDTWQRSKSSSTRSKVAGGAR